MSADRDQLGLFDDNPEYEAFEEKFKPKKTTDDCYTPPKVYEAIAEWVREEYQLGAAPFLRPFHPDGDYLHETYPEGAVVVDNPPFSILAQIVRFYAERQIPFFLFAPALTLLTRRSDVCHIAVGVSIVYANGAEVPTSFVTNLDKGGCILRTAPELYRRIDAAVRAIRAEGAKELPRYAYPDHIVTAAMAQRWSRYGVEYRLQAAECMRVAGLDAQKPFGKSIFGGGYLLSERAAAERAAAQEWQLSTQEKEWVQILNERATASVAPTGRTEA